MVFIAYGAAALAVLTKGPVGVVLPGLTIFIYIVVTRRWAHFRELINLPGFAVFLILAAPWYLYMYKAHGNSFIDTFFGLHNYIRATVSEHPKDNVVYYYLVLFPVSLLPWTGIFLRMILRSVREFGSNHVGYLLTWIVVIISFYTAMATKYPTYVFPAVFPAAILMGRHLDQMLSTVGRRVWLWLTVPTLLLLLLVGIGVKILSPTHGWYLIDVVVFIGAIVILGTLYKGNGRSIAEAVTVSTVAVILLLNSQVFPYYADVRSAKTLAGLLPKQGAVVAAYGDYPASAVFYSGYLLPELVKNNQDFVPHGDWAAKYTMPRETVDGFLRRTHNQAETYVVVDKGSEEEFLRGVPAQEFVPVAIHAKLTLFKKVQKTSF